MALARWQATILDGAGNIQPGASIEVRREGAGGTLVSLYGDRDGTAPIGNPFEAGADGLAAFHVPGGAYRITATKGGFTQVWRYVAIGLASESDNLTTGISWAFDEGVADADPGDGALRFNNAAPAAVTQLYIDTLSRFGRDVGAWLAFLDDNGTAANRGTLVLQTADGAGLMVATVTGAVADGGGYRKVTVTPVVASGSFAAGAAINVQFTAGPVAGVDGLPAGLPFTFSNATAMADPGNGVFRLNNAALAGVTAAAIDDLSAATGNPDVSAAVLSWDDSTNTANRGTLLIKSVAAPQNYALYRITGLSTDNAGWTQLALTHVASAGSFPNGTLCSIEFAPAGAGDMGEGELRPSGIVGGQTGDAVERVILRRGDALDQQGAAIGGVGAVVPAEHGGGHIRIAGRGAEVVDRRGRHARQRGVVQPEYAIAGDRPSRSHC